MKLLDDMPDFRDVCEKVIAQKCDIEIRKAPYSPQLNLCEHYNRTLGGSVD